MKKLLGIVVLGLFFNSNSYAETWSCSYLFDGEEKLKVMQRVGNNFYSVYEHGLANQGDKIVKEINENSNIQIITKNKNGEEISNLLDELIKDHKEQSNLRKIESLENKLINNLDENSYSELIKLKSQLNRE